MRVADELLTAPPPTTTTTPVSPKFTLPERLLRLLDLSDRLQHDPAVVTAFCRFDAGTLALAPTTLRCDNVIVHAACKAHPIALAQAMPCIARRDLGIFVALRRSALDGARSFSMVGGLLPRPVDEHTGGSGGGLGGSHGVAFVAGPPPLEGERPFLV